MLCETLIKAYKLTPKKEPWINEKITFQLMTIQSTETYWLLTRLICLLTDRFYHTKGCY